MANLCAYLMKVKGSKKNIEEFIKVMKAGYNYHDMEFDFDRHMGGRVFEANVIEITNINDDLYYAIIDGDCAWSVSSCMFYGSFSYYDQLKAEHKDKCRSTTIPIESKNLNLDIEIFSEEVGCEFMEHYILKQGDILCDDCIDYHEYNVEEYATKEEAEKELQITIADDDWAEVDDGWLKIGGIEWEFTI